MAAPDSTQTVPPPIANLPSSASGPRFGDDNSSLVAEQGGRIIGGKFRVIREIGHGGMGAVYEVVHEITRHRRALKLLKHSENDEHVVRLLREASAAGRTGSPHIVETYDAGRLESGEAYVLMELLEGDTLFDYIRKQSGLQLAELIDLITQACEGLHAAHEQGIVHRDVKPGNLFVTSKDGKPFVKVLDFGISKFDIEATDATELTGDEFLGTPAYMAPEQLRNKDGIDRRVDIYALGITLYAVCGGRRPFRGSVGELIAAILGGEHTPLWAICPFPRAFCEKVERAMAKDRDDRWPTARAFAAALREDSTQRIDARALPPPIAPEEKPATAPAPRLPLSETMLAAGVERPVVAAADPEPTPVDPPATNRPRTGLALAIGGAIGIAALVLVGSVVATRPHPPPAQSLVPTMASPPAPSSSSSAPTVLSPLVSATASASATPAPTAPASAPVTAPRPPVRHEPVSASPPAKPSATFQRTNPYP